MPVHFAWCIDFWGTLSVLDTGRWEAFHKLIKQVWSKSPRHRTHINRNLAVKERLTRAALRLLWKVTPAATTGSHAQAAQVGHEIAHVDMQPATEGGRTPIGAL